MDVAGDAQGSRALTILPADLQDRAKRNRSGQLGGDPTSSTVYPGSPPGDPAEGQPPAPGPVPPPATVTAAPGASSPPAPPPASPPPALHAVHEADEDLTIPRAGEKPTEHVLRLAGDVRMLRHALDGVRKQLADAVAAATLEAIARQTAEAEAATARASVQADNATARAAAQAEYASARAAIAAELADVRSDAQRLNAEIQRLTADLQRAIAEVQRRAAENEQLKQAVDSAHRQADEWSARAGQVELKLKAIATDRDAANRRVAELEAELTRARTPHPRGGIRALTAPGLPTSVAPAVDPEAPLHVAHWRGAGVATDVHEEHPVSLANEIALDPWQEDALGAWGNMGYRGVVESVTTDGNMRLAFWAIGRALDNDMKVLVLAPSAERVDHWYDELRAVLPINRVGKHAGGKGNARLAAYDVVVATGQGAIKEHIFEPGLGVLAVYDEVHEFGSDALSKALDPSYMWRLGLTSSYERDDDGVAMYLDRYFGGAVFRLNYDRAVSEQVIASYDLAFVSVPLSDAEQTEHDACAAATLAGSGGAKAAVRAYLKAVARRDEILAGTTARDSVLRSLAAVVRNAGKALVIVPSAQVAAHVERVFAGQGCVTVPARIGFDGEARNRRGGKAEDERDVWLLVGPRGWDQPEDVSDVELAIVVSPPRTRRQVIERMDRVLGGKPAGFHVRYVVLYVEGSIEDDTVSEEARSIAAVRPQPKRSGRFSSRDTDALYEFLVAGRRVVQLPPDPALREPSEPAKEPAEFD